MSTSSIQSIADIVRIHGEGRANDTCLVEGDRVITWAQMYERAQRVANGLATNGVGNQDRIAFLDKNGIAHFDAFFGASLLNAVCVDVNWRLAAPEVEYIVNDADAKVMVVGPDFIPIIDAIADKLTTVKKILVIGGHPKFEDFESWMNAQSTGDPGNVSQIDDVAFQLYSSGTTGRPKGVMLSNYNMFGMLDTGKQMWGITRDTVNMVAMPLFHIGGGGWAVAGMSDGGKSIIVRDLDPTLVVKLIEQHKITHTFLVPVALQFMLMVPGVDEADFSSLKTIVYGASPISEDVLARSVQTFKCDFWQAYGLTETTGAVINLPPADHDVNGPNKHRLRSCGIPGPGVEVRIVDNDTGNDVPVGEVGEIWIRGQQVMKGYWKMPEETAKSITPDKWFRSGDAGYMDKDGYVYIHDRVKDMIVSGGENVYPAEVENVLMSHPGIADVAVIGVPHEKWGETPKAIVVRAAGTEATEEEIIAFAQSQLAKFKCPTSVDFIDMLPRNPSGKILKKDLREPFWAGRERRVN